MATFFAIFFILYFLPTIVAIAGKANGVLLTFLGNLFFGWTFIGWLICLYLAIADALQAREMRRYDGARVEANLAAERLWYANHKTCPRCAEHIKSAALVCPHCRHEFQFLAGPWRNVRT